MTAMRNVFQLSKPLKNLSKIDMVTWGQSLRASGANAIQLSGGNSWTIARRGPLGMRWRTCGSVAWPSALSRGAPVSTSCPKEKSECFVRRSALILVVVELPISGVFEYIVRFTEVGARAPRGGGRKTEPQTPYFTECIWHAHGMLLIS